VRVLVTGAAGFVGRHLRPALERRGHVVVGLVSPRAGTSDPLAVDLGDREATARAVTDARPDAVIHLAARARPATPASMREVIDNNVHAVHSVLEAVRCLGAKIKVVVASSSAVYGVVPIARNPILEEEPLRPVLPYGVSKAGVEAVASAYAAQGLDVVTVRPFNLIGPRQGAEFVVARFAQQIAQVGAGMSEPVIETGPLEPVRDFTDVRDAVRAYVAFVEQRTGPGPFNICSGVPRSVGEVLREMLAIAGLEAAIRPHAGAGTPPGLDVPYQCGSRAAIAQALRWEPEIAWRETLRDTLADWRQRIGGGAR
jgi:GDP-4-dehydro-6-deoxy-D-mannose reductase